MPKIIVFGFVALIGSKILCVCFHSCHKEIPRALLSHCQEEEPEYLFHLPFGKSFVTLYPLKEEIIMLPWALLKKKNTCKEKIISYFNRLFKVVI